MKFEAIANNSKHFVSLKDGEEVIGVFLGEPYVFRTHWGEGRSTVCKGDDCDKCSAGSEGKFRFRLNMAVKGEGVKIYEGGAKVYRALSELNEEYPLEDGFVKIKRTGSTKNDTQYNVLPALKEKLTDQVRAALNKMELLPLDPADPFWGAGNETHKEEESVPF